MMRHLTETMAESCEDRLARNAEATQAVLDVMARLREPPAPPPLAAGPLEPVLSADGELLPASPAKRNDLELARQVAKDDPRMVANVVKNWVGAE